MTYAAARLLELRRYLKQWTGLPDAALGIVGDENHVGGYHHGWSDRRIVNRATSDYSWSSARDLANRSEAASAIDVGQFARLRELSVWLVDQCQANAPDTLDIRSIIYSPDGQVVRRWDRLGRSTTGDLSHLTHTHISFFRDAEHRDKTGPFRRFFGDDMDQTEALIGITNAKGRTVGAVLADVSNLRDAMIGAGAAYPPDAVNWPKVGSPLHNLARLPQLLAEHAAAPVDPAALAAVVKPMLDAMEARLEAKIRDAVADGLEGGAAGVRASQ